MSISSATTATPRAANAIRPPATVWLYLALSWLMGWWMALDGLHQRLWGDYVRVNGQLGPWADLVRGLGVDPHSLGMLFVVLGSTMLGASFGVYLRRRWGYGAALVSTSIGLLYLGFGTPVALACLVLLLLGPTRRYVLGRGG